MLLSDIEARELVTKALMHLVRQQNRNRDALFSSWDLSPLRFCKLVCKLDDGEATRRFGHPSYAEDQPALCR